MPRSAYALFHLAFWVPPGLSFPFFFPLLASRGVRPGELGLIAALVSIGSLLAQPAAGWLCDRLGAARVVLCALSLASGAVTPLFAIAHGFLGEAAVALGFALVNGPTAPLGDALTVAYIRRHGGEYGRLRLWGSLSFAAAGVIAGLALRAHTVDLRTLYAIAGAVYVIPAVMPLRFREEVSALRQPRASWRALRGAPAFLSFVALATLALLALNANGTYVSVYLGQLGGGAAAVGFSWAVAATAEAPFFFIVAAVERRFGLLRTFLLAFALGTAGLTLIGIATGPAMVAAGMALQGPAFAIFYGAAVGAVDRLVPAGLRASGQTLLWAGCFGVGAIAGNGGAGLVAGAVGLRGLYRVLPPFSALAALGFLVAARRVLPEGGRATA